ncbi:MAG: aminotransferase class III-fold pyridoxal phosphate-dependent enzyme [Desulfobacterales bacterium]|nr:aminotransferase class III-fold pyridoxal phosphate-dependent enzyme [Desulfobacterales bacterium]
MRAEGVYFWDADGKRYLDFSSQLMNTNIGHQHPKGGQGDSRPGGKVDALSSPGNGHRSRAACLAKNSPKSPPAILRKTFFCLGGAEANENAIKIARFYTGRHKILARYRSYHGATHGAMALTGDYRRLPVEPAMPGVVHFLDPYLLSLSVRAGRRRPAIASASATSKRSSSTKVPTRSRRSSWKA